MTIDDVRAAIDAAESELTSLRTENAELRRANGVNAELDWRWTIACYVGGMSTGLLVAWLTFG